MNPLFIQCSIGVGPHRRPHALRDEYSASAVLAPRHVVCQNYGREIAHVAPLTFFYRSRGPRQCSLESEKANRWHHALGLGTRQRLGISIIGRRNTNCPRLLISSGLEAFYASMLLVLLLALTAAASGFRWRGLLSRTALAALALGWQSWARRHARLSAGPTIRRSSHS